MMKDGNISTPEKVANKLFSGPLMKQCNKIHGNPAWSPGLKVKLLVGYIRSCQVTR